MKQIIFEIETKEIDVETLQKVNANDYVSL
jgi:hypothetical protein